MSVKYEVFEPVVEPTHVVVMSNILGGTLQSTGPIEGDNAYRARWISEHDTGEYGRAAVIAYDRPGTGRVTIDLGASSAVKPNNYATTAAITGRAIEHELQNWPGLPVVFAGASSSALDLTEITLTQTAEPDYLALFDTVGVEEISKSAGFKRWAKYQIEVEGQKPPEAINQNPMTSQGPWTPLSNVKGLVRAVLEMRRYADTWQRPRALSNLQEIASNPVFVDITTRLEIPEHTFITTPAGQQKFMGELATAADVRGEADAPFALVFRAGKYHSWTDDPARFQATIQDTLALRPIETK